MNLLREIFEDGLLDGIKKIIYLIFHLVFLIVFTVSLLKGSLFEAVGYQIGKFKHGFEQGLDKAQKEKK